MFTLSQLFAKTTTEAVEKQMYDYMAAAGLTTTAWQAFSPTRVLVHVFAIVLAATINLVVDVIRGGFISTAEGDWLALTSKEVYNVDKIEATFATGTNCLVLNNSGGGVYHFDPDQLVVKNTITGKTYRNTNVVDVGALQTGVLVSLRADEIGTDSNATPGQITTMVTTALGVTCTNTGAVVGQSAEADQALRDRDLAKLASLSPNGAKGAYEYVAKTPTLNGNVSVNRAKIPAPPGDGTLQVIVANPLGPVSSGDVALVQAGIDKYATPSTVTATVVSAVAAVQSYTVLVWLPLKSGLTTADVTSMVRTALVNYINSLPIGGLNIPPGNLIPWRALVGVVENASLNNGTTRPIAQAKLASEVDVVLASNAVATLDPLSVAVVVTFTTD